jgi:hypothetical protein
MGFSCLALLACSKTDGATPPPPKRSAELPPGWSLFSPPDKRYSVALPGKPEINARTVLEVDEKGPGDIYAVLTWFVEDQELIDLDIDKGLDANVVGWKRKNPKKVSPRVAPITTGDGKMKGRSIQDEVTEDGVTITEETRLFHNKNRWYQVQATVTDPAARSRYLDSFAVLPTSAPTLPSGWSFFQYADAGFGVALPGTPSEAVTVELEVDQKGPGDIYMITDGDEEKPVADIDKELENDVAAWKRKNPKAVKFSVAPITTADGAVKGRAIQHDVTEEGVTVTTEIRLFQTTNRWYQVQATVTDPVARARYLDSFKILK